MTLSDSNIFEALVVGAGPAGIAAVGNLLDHGIKPVCWIDESFEGGRIHQHYREVPANLKAKGFVAFARSLDSFSTALETTSERTGIDLESCRGSVEDGYRALCALPQDKECLLSYGADMCMALIRGLACNADVTAIRGRVVEGSLDRRAANWRIRYRTSSSRPHILSSVRTNRLVLCTGSSPFALPFAQSPDGTNPLSLDVALSPKKLQITIPPGSRRSVLVIGSSHSAVLVLKNLVDLATQDGRNLKVKWLYCHEPQYAEWENGAYIARDNTGLKGLTAAWAKKHLNLSSANCHTTGPNVIEPVKLERRLDLGELYHYSSGMHYVVQALGYKADPLPVLRDDTSSASIDPQFDHNTGGFFDLAKVTPSSVPGLYAAGIAFPALHWDEKYQFWEHAIGFPAFMRALKKWVPEWQAVC